VTDHSIVEFKVWNYFSMKTDSVFGSAKCNIKELLQKHHGKRMFLYFVLVDVTKKLQFCNELRASKLIVMALEN